MSEFSEGMKSDPKYFATFTRKKSTVVMTQKGWPGTKAEIGSGDRKSVTKKIPGK